MPVLNVGLLDLKIGNLKSVLQILKKINKKFNIYIINKKFRYFNILDKMIIPGHGCSYDWIKQFLSFNYNSIVDIFINKYILGICIGKHIFFKNSSESVLHNLNFFKGTVKKFKNSKVSLNVPSISWYDVYFTKNHKLFFNLKNNSKFYFSHSYFLTTNYIENIYAITRHNNFFPSIFINNNICLVQFHPEKSSFQGFQFIKNFCNWEF